MSVTINNQAPNATQKQEMATAFDLVRVNSTGNLIKPDGSFVSTNAGRSLANLDIFDMKLVSGRRQLTLPTPYSGVGPDVVHPSVIYAPQGWAGYRFWMAYTPYPTANSLYENPCIACSHDGETWVTPQGVTLPLVGAPTVGYNADTHLVLSPDNKTLYMAFRVRIPSGVDTGNHIKIIESTDGINWSSPIIAITGTYGSQDYASPSIFWDASLSKWVMISHNLDGGASYPMQQNITSGTSIYTGWGAPSAVTIANPTAGRTFWHSSFDKLPDGRVVGIVQDVVNGGAGAAGALFVAESLDNGLTFSVKKIYSEIAYYRTAFTCFDVAGGNYGMHVWIGRQIGGFTISREDWVNGADQLARSDAMSEIASLGSYRSSILWFSTFNQADGALVAPLVGSAGTVSAGTFVAASNMLSTNSAGGNRILYTLTTSDYAYEGRIGTTVAQYWIIFRATNSTNYWRLGSDTAGTAALKLQNIAAGAISSNVTLTGNSGIGQGVRFRVICRGKRFKIYIDDAFIAEVQDNSGRHATGVMFGVQADNAGTTFDYLLAMA